VCEWLELNLDDYCHKTTGYPLEAKPVPSLDTQLAATYSEGLDEITHNLQESQDFFSASLDGRLQQFHEQEKEIVESQLALVRKYPEDSQRRKAVEAELQADLAFVEENMTGNTSDTKRREKMLHFHSDFLKVLKYHKEKLKALYFEPVEGQAEKKFDNTFDIYNL